MMFVFDFVAFLCEFGVLCVLLPLERWGVCVCVFGEMQGLILWLLFFVVVHFLGGRIIRSMRAQR